MFNKTSNPAAAVPATSTAATTAAAGRGHSPATCKEPLNQVVASTKLEAADGQTQQKQKWATQSQQAKEEEAADDQNLIVLVVDDFCTLIESPEGKE